MNTISTRLFVLCLFAGLPLLAQQREKKVEELDPVIIVGGFATPQMWKVSKDGHVMWVLNIGEPAPVGVLWRTEKLEARIAQSQLMLYQNSTPWTYPATFGPSIRRKERYSGKATLQDELPPDIYARWHVLKTRYFGRDDAIEKWRPSVAIGKLAEKVRIATRQPPSPTGPDLWPLVKKAAKKYKVKAWTMPTVHRPRIAPTSAEQEMMNLSHAQELGDMTCFTQHLAYIEQLFARGTRQAKATPQDYAEYVEDRLCDLLRLTRAGLPDPEAARSAYDKSMLQPKLAWRQVDEEWIAAAMAALERNKSTFAVLNTRWAWDRSNYIADYIAQFREQGYAVDEPGSVID